MASRSNEELVWQRIAKRGSVALKRGDMVVLWSAGLSASDIVHYVFGWEETDLISGCKPTISSLYDLRRVCWVLLRLLSLDRTAVGGA